MMDINDKIFTPKILIEKHPEVGSEAYLANLRCRKIGPCYFKLGRKVLYREVDILAWLFAHPVLTIDSQQCNK